MATVPPTTHADQISVACDRAVRRGLEAEGFRTILLPKAADRRPKVRAIDDLMVARWRGAQQVLVRDRERAAPSNHPKILAYLAEHGTKIGPGPGGVLWALPPLPPPGPPAVFCLGLTKTGTSTLAEALSSFGVRCFHWGGQPAHRAVLTAASEGELLTSRLPAGWDGFADVGSLTHRFELLDLQYPGSRFILTVRDVDAWVDSQRRHVERNQKAEAIGRYEGPILEVKEDGWRELWDKHTAGVEEYFAGRDDLLVLDLTARPRWDELAAFFGREAPSEPFPAANVNGRPSTGRYPTFRRDVPDDDPTTGAPTGRVEAECPLCGTVAERFEASGTVRGKADVRCPTCGSLERHRAMWIFLVDRTEVFRGPARVLHLGAGPLLDRLQQEPDLRCDQREAVASTKRSRLGLRRGGRGGQTGPDAAHLDAPDGTYDLVIASHLLQLVPDDRAVLKELARVIAPGGALLATVPMYGPTTDDEPGADRSSVHRPRFDESGRVRTYGNDGAFERRVREAGFHLMVEDVGSSIDDHGRARFRLARPEPLHWAQRV